MKKEEYKNCAVTFFITAIILMIIHNLNIDSYLKNVTIPFLVLFLEYLYYLKKKVNKESLYLIIPTLLIIISNIFIDIAPINRVLNVIIIPLLLSIIFFTLTNKNYSICSNSITWIFYLVPEGLIKNLELLKNEKKKTSIGNVVIGVVIGVIVACIMLSILMDADKYFMTFINNIRETIDFEMILKNIILVAVYFIVLFSVLVNVFKLKDKKVNKIEVKHQNDTTLTIILSFINLVFVLFLVSEISKITNNFLQIPVEYTYAEYAREGFFQLIFITAINFAIIIYHIYYIDNIKKSKTNKNLIITLIGFSILLIFNSYYRMCLYIGQYGLTILRLQVVLFLAMELGLFIVLTKKIIKGLKNKDVNIIMIILFITYILNLYLCNDWFINLI